MGVSLGDPIGFTALNMWRVTLRRQRDLIDSSSSSDCVVAGHCRESVSHLSESSTGPTVGVAWKFHPAAFEDDRGGKYPDQEQRSLASDEDEAVAEHRFCKGAQG